MGTYEEYLGQIDFTILKNAAELKEEMLINLETKKGYVIEGKYEIYVSRKFEPMKILNQITVFEKLDTYYVIDMFGAVMYEGNVQEVIEYAEGFMIGDDGTTISI